MSPNMRMCSCRRGRSGRTLRKMLARKALPEGHYPQSRRREMVMSLLEMGKERQMPLGAAGSEGPSQPGLDKTRPGYIVRWPTQHIVRTGRGPPKSPSQPGTKGPKLGQLQTQALLSRWGSEQRSETTQQPCNFSQFHGQAGHRGAMGSVRGRAVLSGIRYPAW